MVASNTTFVDQGAIGSFAIGEFVQGQTAPNIQFPYFPGPVRHRINKQLAVALLASGSFQIVTTHFPERVDEAKWHQPYSEPVRQKQGLRAHLQPAYTADTTTFPAGSQISWMVPFGQPVRIKPSLIAALQQPYTIDADQLPEVNVGYFSQYSEPVRYRQGLRSYLQQSFAYHPRILPTPSVTATWNSTETGQDVALFAVYVYDGGSTVARVSIVELTPNGLPVASGNDPVSVRE